MTPAGPPSDQLRSAWHRRFPDLDVAIRRLRLWRVELPVRAPTILAEWIRRATTDGTAPAAAARRLGLPPGAVRAAHGPARRWFAFIDLPGGVRSVSVPPAAFPPWPDRVTSVPPDVLRPPGVDVMPTTDDWRTVPVVRAEAVEVVGVKDGEQIDLYAADRPDGSPLWRVPADHWT